MDQEREKKKEKRSDYHVTLTSPTSQRAKPAHEDPKRKQPLLPQQPHSNRTQCRVRYPNVQCPRPNSQSNNTPNQPREQRSPSRSILCWPNFFFSIPMRVRNAIVLESRGFHNKSKKTQSCSYISRSSVCFSPNALSDKRTVGPCLRRPCRRPGRLARMSNSYSNF